MADFSLPGEDVSSSLPESSWVLEAEEELRLEVESRVPGTGAPNRVTVRVTRGTAELFGTEMQVDKEYVFAPTPSPSGGAFSSSASAAAAAAAASSPATAAAASPSDASSSMRFAIFSWHGAEIQIRGHTRNTYKKSDTPMVSYINAHAALENLRQLTRDGARKMGPRTMVVGPADSGRSTLCRILLSYAVRAGNAPLFVDLDVGHSSISVPGSISATSVEHPISVELAADIGGGGGSSHAIGVKSPLSYFYGHTSPAHAPELYGRLLEKLASVVERRMVEHSRSNVSGLVLNTCGVVDPTPGSAPFELLLRILAAFSIDVLLVLDHDQLAQSLRSEARVTQAGVHVAQLSKSGGVHARDEAFRRAIRARSIREYFYGPSLELTPHAKTLAWKEVEIYRVGGGPAAPASALPIGAKRMADPNKLTRVQPSVDLLYHLLALSYAKESASLLEANVAGFVHVTAVDMQKKTITLLTPAPGPLPNNIFLVGSIKWQDA